MRGFSLKRGAGEMSFDEFTTASVEHFASDVSEWGVEQLKASAVS